MTNDVGNILDGVINRNFQREMTSKQQAYDLGIKLKQEYIRREVSGEYKEMWIASKNRDKERTIEMQKEVDMYLNKETGNDKPKAKIITDNPPASKSTIAYEGDSWARPSTEKSKRVVSSGDLNLQKGTSSFSKGDYKGSDATDGDMYEDKAGALNTLLKGKGYKEGLKYSQDGRTIESLLKVIYDSKDPEFIERGEAIINSMDPERTMFFGYDKDEAMDDLESIVEEVQFISAQRIAGNIGSDERYLKFPTGKATSEELSNKNTLNSIFPVKTEPKAYSNTANKKVEAGVNSINNALNALMNARKK